MPTFSSTVPDHMLCYALYVVLNVFLYVVKLKEEEKDDCTPSTKRKTVPDDMIWYVMLCIECVLICCEIERRRNDDCTPLCFVVNVFWYAVKSKEEEKLIMICDMLCFVLNVFWCVMKLATTTNYTKNDITPSTKRKTLGSSICYKTNLVIMDSCIRVSFSFYDNYVRLSVIVLSTMMKIMMTTSWWKSSQMWSKPHQPAGLLTSPSLMQTICS